MTGYSIIILALACCALLVVNAQGPPPQGLFGSGGLSLTLGMSKSQIYQNVILQSAAAKLTTTGLPADLQLQVDAALASAELGFTACDDLALSPILAWQQKRCAALQLRNTLLQLSQIQQEATLRASAATENPATNDENNVIVALA